MNILSDDTGMVVVFLAEGGSDPIDISECVRVEFPRNALAACMANDITRTTGFIPYFVRTYLHRGKGLLFVATVPSLVDPRTPMVFFQASKLHVERALSVFDAASRARWEAMIRYEPAAALPAPAPPEPEATPRTSAGKAKRARGDTDERATAEYMKNPSLTFKQLAAIVGCDSSTLRNSRRCPKLARAREATESHRLDYHSANVYHDRRGDD